MARASTRNNGATGGYNGRGKQVKSQPFNLGSPFGKPCGRKPTSRIIEDAVRAYHAGLTLVCQIIAEWDDVLDEKAGILDPNLEEWKDLVLDPGHCLGCTSQYK